MISVRSIFGYTIGVVPTAADVRKLTTYALTVDPALAVVRKISAYALIPDIKTLEKGKSSLELLYKLINNNTNVAVYDETTLEIGEVVSESYQGMNSKVKVSATANTRGYSGSTYLRYNRVEISRSFSTTDIDFTIDADTTIHGLLSKINTAKNLKLVPADVVDAVVRSGAKQFSLVAAGTSYLYVPGTTIQLGSPYQELSDIITVTDLPGFERVMFELDDIIKVVDLPGFEPVTV